MSCPAPQRPDQPAVQAAISRATAGYGQLTVADRAAFVASAGTSVSTVLAIVYALLVLAIVIAVSGIANTLSLSVYERTREIGLLRAVGQTRAQLRSMVRLESVLVAAFGTAGGLALGGFLGWGLAEAGRPVLGADPAQLAGRPAHRDRPARRAGRRHRRHPPGPAGGPAAGAGRDRGRLGPNQAGAGSVAMPPWWPRSPAPAS